MRMQLWQPTLQKLQREGVTFLAESTMLSLLTLGSTTRHAVMAVGMGFPVPGKKGAGLAQLGL